eukprot:10754140-Alexandrium_andersonii.AAC.1
MELHQQQRRLQGKPYMLYNEFTRRWDYLYIKRGINQQHTEEWQQVQVQQKADEKPSIIDETPPK